MIYRDINEHGEYVEIESTFEEWHKLWNPFLEAQPEDEIARKVYRKTVDKLCEHFPIRHIPIKRVVDYAKFDSLMCSLSERSFSSGCSFGSMDVLVHITRTVREKLFLLILSEIKQSINDEKE